MGTMGTGTRVLAEWVDGGWYAGRIEEVSADASQRFVVFDDGDRAWVGTDRVVALPLPGAAMPAVGARVAGLWSTGGWYLGRLSEVASGKGFVEFDDGDTAWLDAAGIIALPPSATATLGAAVGAHADEASADAPSQAWAVGLVTRFFSLLAAHRQPEASALVHLSKRLYGERPEAESWAILMDGLRAQIADWRGDGQPAAGTDWLPRLGTPGNWSFDDENRPCEDGDQILVSPSFDGAPTDVTAKFRVALRGGKWAIELEDWHVM